MSDDGKLKKRSPRLGDADDGVGLSHAERLVRDLGPRPQQLIQLGPRVARKQGCWNCTGFDREDIAKKRWEELRLRDLRVLLGAGMTLEDAEQRLSATDHLTKPPLQGVCLRGKSGTDLVQFNYLCDSWVGRVNPHTVPGEKADELPDELLTRLGFKPRGGG